MPDVTETQVISTTHTDDATIVEKKVVEKKVITPLDKWLNKGFEQGGVRWFHDDGTLKPPTEHKDNLLFRDWLRRVEYKGVDDSGLMKHRILKQCESDIHFFFNAFLWTQDPRKRPSDLPFITYDYEKEYTDWIVKHINEKKDCFTEKSRDMGISWTILGIILHQWLFKKGFLAHLGSKKEDDVDRSGDIRSLFEKMRYMLRSLPKWVVPYGFHWQKHSMFMRLLNPYQDSAITGESSNRDFGRAGRYSLVLLDEFAFMEYADEAWTACGDSTPCRIAASTPNGTGNKFWQLRFKSSIDRFTAHWTMHPEKSYGAVVKGQANVLDSYSAFKLWTEGSNMTSPWYDNEVNRRLTKESQSSIDIAQELDIDYLVSGNPYFDTKLIQKQKEWEITKDWPHFQGNGKVIVGILTEIDGKIEFRQNDNGWLRLFEKPSPQGQYTGGLDPAAGSKTGDHSAGAFRNKHTRNLVASMYGHYDYDELSYYGLLTSRFFGNCLVCAEAGGYGAAVNKRMFDLGGNVARTVDVGSGGIKDKDKLGFNTTTKSRPQLLGDIAAEIREEAAELRDKDLITECLNFVVKNGKAQASEGSTDDFIFAWGIAGQLMRYYPYSSEIEKGFKQRARDLLNRRPKPNQGMAFRRK